MILEKIVEGDRLDSDIMFATIFAKTDLNMMTDDEYDAFCAWVKGMERKTRKALYEFVGHFYIHFNETGENNFTNEPFAVKLFKTFKDDIKDIMEVD